MHWLGGPPHGNPLPGLEIDPLYKIPWSSVHDSLHSQDESSFGGTNKWWALQWKRQTATVEGPCRAQRHRPLRNADPCRSPCERKDTDPCWSPCERKDADPCRSPCERKGTDPCGSTPAVQGNRSQREYPCSAGRPLPLGVPLQCRGNRSQWEYPCSAGRPLPVGVPLQCRGNRS